MRRKVSLLLALSLIAGCRYVTPQPAETPSLSPAPVPSPSASTSISPSATASPTSSSTISPSPTSSASPTPTLSKRTVALYYVGQIYEGSPAQYRLYREFRSIPSTADTGLYSLQYLLKRGQEALDQDYLNFWGNGSVIHYIKYSGNTATVDISVVPLRLKSEPERRAIDQLVWTLTANHPSTKYVLFTSGGKQFQSFSGFVDATQKFSRERHYEVLAAVWVNQLRATMSNPVTITGTACTFEAGVHWILIRNGEQVREGHTLAAGACPMRGAWSVSLGSLSHGDYTFVAQDISAKDGSVTQEDSKDFKIK